MDQKARPGSEAVDAYLAQQPGEARPHLARLRALFREVLPGAQETIAWGMPTYRQKRNIIHFAAHKRHAGVYPGAGAVAFFAPRLKEAGYTFTKGAIRFPYAEALPEAFLRELAAWCLQARLAEEEAKAKPKENKAAPPKEAGEGARGPAAKEYAFDAVIHEIPQKGGAYVVFPYDIRQEFGKGRVAVSAAFDGLPYEGSLVNMGLRDEEGRTQYILGLLKAIRQSLGKGAGDTVHVRLHERAKK